jgi:hypothetical protein
MGRAGGRVLICMEQRYQCRHPKAHEDFESIGGY